MGKFDIEETAIRKLADLLEEKGLSEIEITEDKRKLRVARNILTAQPSLDPGLSNMCQPVPDSLSVTGSASETTGEIVLSPMVGVVYLSPDPGSPNFIKADDMVNEGDTLLLIEAMKTFNPLRAPRSGKIKKILISDKMPVEFGEELVIIE